jgi:acetylglutamate kinase
MVHPDLRKTFAQDILFLHSVGIKPVVVHGGGPQISAMLNQLGIQSEFQGGFRVTTPEAMDVVRMVLTGKISRELVGEINQHSTHLKGVAVGISGEDGAMFQSVRKFGTDSNGNQIDLGLVGDIVAVDPSAVQDLLSTNRIPVISTVAPNVNNHQEVMNINADIAAGRLAAELNAKKLVILTDVLGLYANYPDESSLISRISTSELRKMLSSLDSGMVPKMSACLDAVENGVGGAHVIDGRRPHSLLVEIFTREGIGTLVER